MSGKAFAPPNYTKVPNLFLDGILPNITALSELKVTLAIMRQTFGWQKKEDALSLSQLERLTGLSRKSVAEGVKLALGRGYVGRRKVGSTYVYGLRVASVDTTPPKNLPSEDIEPVASEESTPTKEREKESNDSSSKDSESANGEKTSPMPMGQFGMKELKERLTAARKRSAQVHTPTDRELKDFGFQFKQADKDGHSLDDMLLALDYMVAKASGEVENEPKAWCGYRTALDRVLDGWRPARALRVVRNPEHERMREENQAMLAELVGDVS